MSFPARIFGCCLLLALAGCVQQAGGHAPTVRPTVRPTGDYAVVAGVAHADGAGAAAAADKTFVRRGTNAGAGMAGDARPADTFRYYFVHAVRGAKPVVQGMAGNGASPTAPLFAHSVAGRDELQAAMNDLLARYPDRRDVGGSLLRSAKRKYLLYVTFMTTGGARALYYDVTRWVEFNRTHG